jgi:SAM-dependent methyltransferase
MDESEIKEFYEENPFPPCDPDKLESASDLYNKVSSFYRKLDKSISSDQSVLVVGCGTGLLSNLLGLKGRDVTGVDISEESLKIARDVKSNLGIENVEYSQENLMDLDMEENYDVVVSLGVLHHTENPYTGFQIVSNHVRKEGYLVYGAYNKYGRVQTVLRKMVFRLTGHRFKQIDRYLRTSHTQNHQDVVFNDQYLNPREDTRTIGETLEWFSNNNLDFVRCVPSLDGQLSSFGGEVFEPAESCSKPDRVIAQTKWLFNEAGGYGFFIMIGRKSAP